VGSQELFSHFVIRIGAVGMVDMGHDHDLLLNGQIPLYTLLIFLRIGDQRLLKEDGVSFQLLIDYFTLLPSFSSITSLGFILFFLF
jgi:hypothetical protein